MDLVASTMQSVALNFVAASVYQMMRGGTIVTTFLFSVLLLRMKALRRQWIGSMLTVVGILIMEYGTISIPPHLRYPLAKTMYFLIDLVLVNSWLYSTCCFSFWKWISIRLLYVIPISGNKRLKMLLAFKYLC